jgi:hypothetical protein
MADPANQPVPPEPQATAVASLVRAATNGNAKRCVPDNIPDDRLIYDGEDFTVWLSEPLDVWWQTEDAFDAKLEALQKKPEWGEIIAKQTELESLPMGHMTAEGKMGFRSLIGTAILLLLTEQFENSRITLKSAETFYRSRTAERARIWMLESGALVTVALSIWMVVVLWWTWHRGTILAGSLLERMMMGAGAGAWGAFVSLVLRVSVLGIDATAGRRLHYWESVCRVVVGVVAGALAVCGIAAGLIAPEALKLGTPLLLLVGFVAGFSERFLPGLVGKTEAATGIGNPPAPVPPPPQQSSQPGRG